MRKKRILIVDDEEDFGKTIKKILETTGRYEALAETDGVRAVEIAEIFNPDLILLDIAMPEIDGGDVARRILSHKNLKDVPIIFLTALIAADEIGTVKGIVEDRPFYSLAKPVSAKRLISCIKDHIGG
ncbi:MAG: response regulator [Candidatus Omnitrophica bacterium]|nr:response regulator [Candidatus Omnitrophota bacterium]